MPADPCKSTLHRFISHDQKRLAACAAVSPRVAQLAVSFPLLFTMLATQYGAADKRDHAVRAAVAGRPLRDVAAALGVPMALKHVPPEACPQVLHAHAWTPQASRVLRPFIPVLPEKARCWLEAIFFAARLGGEDIGLWIARQTDPHKLNEAPLRLLFPLVLYAWITRHEPKLLGTAPPWTPAVTGRSALSRCKHWSVYLEQAAAMGAFGVADPWIPKTTIEDHTLLPLTTISAIAEEAAAWNNCLLDYVPFVADDSCRLFSIRRRGKRVAVIEVVRNAKSDTLIIAQVAPMRESELSLYDALRALVETTQAPVPRDKPPLAFISKIHLDILLRRYRNFVPACERVWIDELTAASIARDVSNLARWLRYTDRDQTFEARMRAQRRLRLTPPVPTRG